MDEKHGDKRHEGDGGCSGKGVREVMYRAGDPQPPSSQVRGKSDLFLSKFSRGSAPGFGMILWVCFHPKFYAIFGIVS